MKRIFSLPFIIVFTIFVMVGCSSSESSGDTKSNENEKGKPLEIQVSTEAANTNVRVKQLEKLNEFLNEESNDSIKLSIYPGAQLYGDNEAIQEIAAGSFDAAQTLSGSIANLIPELNVLDMPFFFKDNETFQNFLWNTELGDYLIDKMAEQNLLPISLWDPGDVTLILGSKLDGPPNKQDHLRKLVLTDSRIPSWNKSFTAYGATATSMPVVESIPGMAQGTIDGIVGGFTNWLAVFPDKNIAPYALQLPVKYTWFVTVNKKWFDQLPEESQTAILNAAKKSEEWQYEYIYNEQKNAIKTIEEQGREWYTIKPNEEAAWIKPLVPIYKEYEREYGIEFMKMAYEASGKGLEYWNDLGLGLD